MATPKTLTGSVAEAQAIAYYTKAGCVVSIPFSTTTYDLIIERIGGKLDRIQCKYSSKFRYGLRVNVARPVSPAEFDYLFCMDSFGCCYEIPVSEIVGKRTVQVAGKWELIALIPESAKAVPCGRCGKRNETERSVCEKCAEQTRENQRKYRARKRAVKGKQ